MADIDEFRQAVESFIAQRGWTPTRFGRAIAGDPLFVFDLREGREPRSDTRARILKAMQDEGETVALAPLRVGVAGLGNVGATLVGILQKDAAELTRKLGRQLTVAAVSARSRSRERGIDLSGVAWFDDPVALARSPDIDLFVELIGGEDGPAFAAVRAALEIGRPVVTANKALLARHGVALARLAEESGAQLGFEAAVAGGIPVIKTLREGLALIFLAAPTTTPERMDKVLSTATGFLYYISRTGVTGEQDSFQADFESKVAAIKKRSKLPVVVGFGISKPEHVRTVCKLTDGAVVGSALVRRTLEDKPFPALLADVKAFVAPLIAPTKETWN